MKMLRAETYLAERIEQALRRWQDNEQGAQALETVDITLEKPRNEAFGDFATTIALSLAKVFRTNPRRIAEEITRRLEDEAGIIDETTIDGPGFINFRLKQTYWQHYLDEVLRLGEQYGSSTWGEGVKVQVEFVSANPTGPLNVVSARAAAVGDVLVSLFQKVGFRAYREYYINDAGRQIRLLGASVAARYMQLFGYDEAVPEDGYQGDYIMTLAREIQAEHGDRFVGIEKEQRAEEMAALALEKMIRLHQQAMDQYRVHYDVWFRESELRKAGKHLQILERLKRDGYTYEKDGAIWFKSSAFGDEKDRVLLTREGEPTYFLVDIAYHEDKYQRGFEKIYDLWGPDHHGYIARMSAAVQALGHPKESFQVRIIQQVNMLRGGEVVKMSKRKGNIIEMEEVLNEVGVDAARFFFVMRKLDQPLDFDIDLAKKQTEENPVYYVQYAHARVANILQFAGSRNVLPANGSADPGLWLEEADSARLTETEELAVIKKIAEYPEVISKAAKFLEPHRLTTYLMELAGVFHSFYQKHRVVTDDRTLTLARLKLVLAVKQVLKNGLDLLKISAPERM